MWNFTFILLTICALATSSLVRISIRKNDDFATTSNRIRAEKAYLSRKFNTADNGEGVEKLVNAGNFEYYGQINIGTPQQGLSVLFDIGSSNLWVAKNDACDDDYKTCTTVLGFNESLSTSFIKNGKNLTITNGNYSMKGFLGSDDVSIGGLQIKNQVFGLATVDYLPPNFQGIFGMGFKTNAVDNVTPPLNNMILQGLMAEPIFSFDLAVPSGKNTALPGAELILGGSDSSLYIAPMTFLQVNKQGTWQFEIDAVSFEGFQLCKDCQGLVDTGASWIVAPQSEYLLFNALINSTQTEDGLNTVECSTVSTLPDLEFTLNGNSFNLPSSLYIIEEIIFLGESDKKRICMSVIQNTGTDFWIFGGIFVNKYYTEFDFGKQRVGLAPVNPKGIPSIIPQPAPKKKTCEVPHQQ